MTENKTLEEEVVALREEVKELKEALNVIATEACDWSCVKYNYPEHEDEECQEDCKNCNWHTPQAWVEWAKQYVTKK